MKRVRMGSADRQRLIEVARETGFSDGDILREILRGEFGGNHRRLLVVEWGEIMGLDANSALRTAREAGLIPTSHPPRK